MKYLEGYKVYICAALLIIIEVLSFFGVLSPEVATSLEVFLGAGGLAALRHSVSRVNS